MTWRIHQGDALAVLRTLPADNAHACVTDPPYGLSFMGEAWDHAVPDATYWSEVLRVVKPGAHLLAFGGTRTFHRLACAIEDAGWQIRDTLSWLYGQGFPKSLNLDGGLGTALKPAWEPIILARKPLTGTVAENVIEHDTGALNVDACRLGDTVETWPATRSYAPGQIHPGGKGQTQATGPTPPGRWPPNVVLDEDAAAMVDEQGGERTSGDLPAGTQREGIGYGGGWGAEVRNGWTKNSGGAARFFYCPKASPLERGSDNAHPTVKPLALMRWLCRLVTPRGGAVLDPFCGSGSTGIAALREGFQFIGVELNPEYVALANERIRADAPLFAQEP